MIDITNKQLLILVMIMTGLGQNFLYF